MKMNVKSMYLAMLMVVSSMALLAQPAKNQERRPQFHDRQEPLSGLALSETQRTKVDDIHLALQKELLPLKNEMGEKKAKLRTLTTAQKVDMKAINSLIDEMAGIGSNIRKKQAAALQQVRQVLTDEQRIKFDNNPSRFRRMAQWNKHRSQERYGRHPNRRGQ